MFKIEEKALVLKVIKVVLSSPSLLTSINKRTKRHSGVKCLRIIDKIKSCDIIQNCRPAQLMFFLTPLLLGILSKISDCQFTLI